MMDIKKIIKEELNFDWVDDIIPGLVVGGRYSVKAPNGSWYELRYCGPGSIKHPDTGEKLDGYKFKDGYNHHNDECTTWWSDSLYHDKILNKGIKLIG